MTYVNEVTTDAPSLWLRYENSAALGTNSGSATYTEAHAGATAVSQTGELGAGAVSFSTAAGTYQTATPSASELTFQTNASWSVEAWVKRSAVTGIQDVVNRNVGTSPTYIYINNSTATSPSTANAISVQRNNGSTNDYVYGTIPITADGKYHHVVITHDTTVGTGGTTTIYVDGVAGGSKANGSFTNTAASNTNPYYIGANSVTTTGAGNGLAMDEVAVYSKSLSAARVQAHYNAVANPTTGVAVSAPPFVMDPMATVAPSVGIAANAVVVPMGMGPITTVAPTSTVTRNITVASPPMTLSAAAVAPALEIDTPALSVPPMTLSMNSGTAPVVSGTYTYMITNDTDTSSGSGSPTTMKTSSTLAMRTDPFTAPDGYNVKTAKLWVYATAGAGQLQNVFVYPLAWNEASQAGTAGSLTIGTQSLGSFTVVLGWNAIDITSIATQWANGTAPNNGIEFRDAINPATFYTHENATNKPYVEVNYAPMVSANVSVSPLTLGQAFGSAPAVSTVFNLTVAVPAQTMALTFPGGIQNNPDYYGSAAPLTLSMSLPSSVRAFQETSITLAVPPVAGSSISLPSGVSVSTVTNVLVAAKPFVMSNLTMVGIYNAQADPYLAMLPSTMHSDDIWYKLDEASGLTAVDSSYEFASNSTTVKNWQQSGSYVGAPTFLIPDGPQLRKAARFDGVKDALLVGPYDEFYKVNQVAPNDVYYHMAVTIEFSIRTTQQNGVVFVGTGAQSSQLASISPTATSGPLLNGNELRIENGILVIANKAGEKVKVRKSIADGQWHHVVMAIPSGSQMQDSNTGHYDDGVPCYVAVDGQPILARYDGFTANSAWGETWLPFSFMARATKASYTAPAANGFLAGDLRDVIVRLNDYQPLSVSESLYYAWSDSTVITPPPVTLSLSAPAPKVKGSVKRILALYGLAWNYQNSGDLGPLYTYASNLSGMVIKNLNPNGTADHAGELAGPSGGSPLYWKPKAFIMDGFQVNPVSIVSGKITTDKNTTFQPISADGVVSTDAAVNSIGSFVDDATGLPRFINLQDDLSEDVTDYDVVTVVNYPWYKPNASRADVYGTDGKRVYGEGLGLDVLTQHNLGLSDDEWTRARDNLRDSLLQAAYDGVNLWIGEYHAAQHLGFIGEVDIHSRGLDTLGMTLGQANLRAALLDKANLDLAQTQWVNYTSGVGGYPGWAQANAYRRITALVPGLTDIPGNDYADVIDAWYMDAYQPNGDYTAWNILRRPNGFQLGDLIKMSVSHPASKNWSPEAQYSPTDNLRAEVISASPAGVVGTIVAREQQNYYTDNGVQVQNPYADNVVTIAAEVGTIVRGQAIKGRAFIDLMCTEVQPYYILEDADKAMWQGDRHIDQTTKQPVAVSKWDFDTRRSKEIKAQLTNTAVKFDSTTGSITASSLTINYLQFNGTPHIGNLVVPMHARGLNWLSQTPTIAPGDAAVYAQAMTMTLTEKVPTVTTEKNMVVTAPAMNLWLETRQPANYRDGNAVEFAQPMLMELHMGGLGSNSAVPPMVLSLASVAANVVGDVDMVTVYVDNDTSITLFLKEDN